MAKSIVLAASLLLTAQAIAQDAISPKDQEISHYAGLDVALLDLDMDGLFSDTTTAYNATIGTRLGFGKVALEGSTFQTASAFSGDVGGMNSSIDLEGQSIRVIGRAQLTPFHAFIGGFGSHRYKATVSVVGVSESDRETDGSAFIGWEMDTPRLFVRAIYEHYDVDSETDLTGLRVGVGFKFAGR